MKIRMFIDESACLIPRTVDAQDAYIALIELEARRPALRSAVPEPLLATFDGLMSEAAELAGPIESVLPHEAARENDEPTPDPSLLTFVAADVLGDKRKLSHFIASAVQHMECRVIGAAFGPGTEEDARAGLTVHEALFAKGRALLTLCHQHQWVAVHNRFGPPIPPLRSALATLNLTVTHERIRALNEHFGRVLGMDRGDGAAEVPLGEDPIPRFLDFVTRVVCFANLAWPGQSLDACTRRIRLTEPYLGTVRSNDLDHVRRLRRIGPSGEPGVADDWTPPGTMVT